MSSFATSFGRHAVGAAFFLAATPFLWGQNPAAPSTPHLQWICSTESQPWQEQPAVAITTATGSDPAALTINPQTQFQMIDGFGGCFNELGWAALQGVGPAQRTEALRALLMPADVVLPTAAWESAPTISRWNGIPSTRRRAITLWPISASTATGNISFPTSRRRWLMRRD